jgi:hypothetical protein
MGDIKTEEIIPRFLPLGFRHMLRVDGPAAAGFPDVPDQVTLAFARGRARHQTLFPISVHAADGLGLVLKATEKRQGTVINLGSDTSAIYHDGWWTAPAADGAMPQWDSSSIHSLTIHTPTRTYGIRAPRDVSFDELIAVARSIVER